MISTELHKKNKFKHYIYYFLPFIIIFSYHLIIGGYGLFNHAFVLRWWQKIEPKYYIFQLTRLLYYVLYVYYYYQSWRLYLHYRQWIVNEFSDTERVSYRWFLRFLICNIVVFCANIANEIYLYVIKFSYDRMLLSYGSGLVLTYYISIAGYAQSRVRRVRYDERVSAIVMATENNMVENESNTPTEVRKNKPLISEVELTIWKDKLLAVFERDKPYLNAELTLSDLAEQLNTNTSILSQVINKGFGRNFNDFVNQYRVDAFKEKITLKQYQHYTMLAVAFDCGFNSKTTFNRAFKKQTQQMPSTFLQKK